MVLAVLVLRGKEQKRLRNSLLFTQTRYSLHCPTFINTDGVPEVSPSRVRYSLRFVVPGMCYAASNNLYLFALTMVAPPIWTILTSLRTPITTLAYKVD